VSVLPLDLLFIIEFLKDLGVSIHSHTDVTRDLDQFECQDPVIPMASCHFEVLAFLRAEKLVHVTAVNLNLLRLFIILIFIFLHFNNLMDLGF
jgi:hypothetical protein